MGANAQRPPRTVGSNPTGLALPVTIHSGKEWSLCAQAGRRHGVLMAMGTSSQHRGATMEVWEGTE